MDESQLEPLVEDHPREGAVRVDRSREEQKGLKMGQKYGLCCQVEKRVVELIGLVYLMGQQDPSFPSSLKRGHPQRVHHVGLVRLEQGEVDEELVLRRDGILRREPGNCFRVHGFQSYVLCWTRSSWEFGIVTNIIRENCPA